VADTAILMGMAFGGDLRVLGFAGLLHDLAKYYSDEKLLAIAKENNLITDECEYDSPSILHGPVASFILKTEYGIKDEKILEAIRLHTTGDKDIYLETMIIYMADLIEPHREYERIEIIRGAFETAREKGTKEAFMDAVKVAIVEVKKYLERTNKPVHQGVNRMENWLINEKGELK